ncbi:MAG: hypothetical protein J0L88_05055 [Xanthomonadales bacterium]|nr:hypothetical protein [Xanthomonadales bacterium]
MQRSPDHARGARAHRLAVGGLRRLAVLLVFAAAVTAPAHATVAIDTRTHVTLHATGTTPAPTTRISFGIPFAPGELTDPALVRIVDAAGKEVPAAVSATLRWHFRDGSVRAVRVQIGADAMKSAPLRFETGTRRAANLAAVPYAEGLVDSSNGLRMPAVLATLDPRWLARSLIAGPQQPIENDTAYDRYVETQFEWAAALPTSDSTAWLFDRPSTLFKLYVRSGRVEHLRAALESYRFYMAQLVRGGDRCAGGWRFLKANPCDAKYVYVEPIVLALGLAGDDSLHDDALVRNMMAIWQTGGWSGLNGPYTKVDQAFTERHAGLGLLATVAAYELTGDASLREHIGERIGWLDDHQRANPDGLGNDGAWRHSWQRHEGADYNAGTDLRGASPWMSENIIDGLWHAWLVTADARIPPMITAFGAYLEKHGWIAPATIARAGTPWRDDCSGADGQIAWYWSSSQATLDRLIALQDSDGAYSDAHTVELGLPVALARYFETDAAKQAAFDARLDAIEASYAPACARTRSTARRFNWNNRGAAAVPWLRQAADAADPPGIPARPR